MQKIYKSAIATTLYGPLALAWLLSDGRPWIIRIIIPKPASSADREATRLFPDIVRTSCPAIDRIGSEIKASLAGEKITFSLDLIKLDICSEFQRAVLQATHAIPHGSVTSYGLLATHLSKAGAARAVGTALAANPFPILIPCHRVIRSDRTLGDFGGGRQMKKALLTAEGITFDKKGRVDHQLLHYQNP